MSKSQSQNLHAKDNCKLVSAIETIDHEAVLRIVHATSVTEEKKSLFQVHVVLI